jgi:signal transduction histidine kinase
MAKNDQYIEQEKYNKLQKENELLKQKLKKLDSRINSIIKINDKTFKSIFNKNISLEKSINRFDKILQLSDKQGKTILVQKDKQEEILLTKAKMASMGEMIDHIAHQWRQPLSIISTNASAIIVKKECGVSNEKWEINSLNNIIDVSQYLSETINDFRSFLKDDKYLDYFSLYETFKKVELLTKSIIVIHDIKLIIKTEDVQIFGIENEFIQVLMNLISNSIDAFDKNSKTKLILIDLEFEDKNNIIIKFKDSAGGILQENLKKIFSSGFTTKKSTGGTGIGLPMCKNIIQNTFHGTLKVQNETFNYKDVSYKGAVFSIKLPIKEKA